MGMIRKIWSVSSLGLIDFRSDKERIARYSKQSRNELRRQTRIMQGGTSNGVQIVDDFKDLAKQNKERRKLVEVLEQNPRSEIAMWVLYAAITVLVTIAQPGMILIAIPVGIYLFYTRQKAVRNVKQREHDKLALEIDAMEAPTRVIPAIKVNQIGGRHARR